MIPGIRMSFDAVRRAESGAAFSFADFRGLRKISGIAVFESFGGLFFQAGKVGRRHESQRGLNAWPPRAPAREFFLCVEFRGSTRIFSKPSRAGARGGAQAEEPSSFAVLEKEWHRLPAVVFTTRWHRSNPFLPTERFDVSPQSLSFAANAFTGSPTTVALALIAIGGIVISRHVVPSLSRSRAIRT